MEKNFLKILAVIVGLSFFIFWLYFAVFSLDIKTGTWSKKIRSEKEKNDIKLIAGCVSGASVREDYLKIITDAGLKYKILLENKEIGKGFSVPLLSLNIEIYKE